MECYYDDKGYLKQKAGELSFSLQMATGGTPASFVIFDQNGLIDAVLGGGFIKPTIGTINPTVLRDVVNDNPIYIKGFNYFVSKRSQFAEPFDFVIADIDGTYKKDAIITAAELRNSQFDKTLLTIEKKFFINPKSGFTIRLGANITVQLTFFVDETCELNC